MMLMLNLLRFLFLKGNYKENCTNVLTCKWNKTVHSTIENWMKFFNVKGDCCFVSWHILSHKKYIFIHAIRNWVLCFLVICKRTDHQSKFPTIVSNLIFKSNYYSNEIFGKFKCLHKRSLIWTLFGRKNSNYCISVLAKKTFLQNTKYFTIKFCKFLLFFVVFLLFQLICPKCL